MPRQLLVSLLAFACALTACGGEDSGRPSDAPATTAASTGTAGGARKEASQSKTAVTTPPSEVTLPGNVCALLKRDEVEAAIGDDAPGTEAVARSDSDGNTVLVGCTWGAIASDDAAIAVQIGKPSGDPPIDYLETLTRSAAKSAEPIDIGTDGHLLGTAFLPGGGGVGQSVIFEKHGMTVVVGLVRGEQANLEAAARAVEANLS